ncbi:MAG TPA: hypothetical protein VF272_00750 [Candidatus Saccharimonadia bacterium]
MNAQPNRAINATYCMRLLIIIFLGLLPVLAFSASSISNGFFSKTALSPGTIVSQGSSTEVVIPAHASSITTLLGVVTTNSEIAFTSDADKVQVVSGGIAETFVSDAKGDIKAGDKITVGELSGVGVRLSGSGKTVGTAQANFNRKSAGAKTQNVADVNGKTHRIAIGQIPVAVDVADYVAPSKKDTLVPAIVQLFFNHLMGRDVSGRAILVATVLLLAGVIVAGIILYGAVRGGMVSLGRNPLSQRGILRAFGQAALVGLGALMVCAGLAYVAVLVIN